MVEYFKKHDILYDEIVDDKPIATHIIDDTAIEYNNNWKQIVGRLTK